MLAGVLLWASTGFAQNTQIALPERSLNFYGLPGMMDMPTAEAMPDADLAVTASHFGGSLRTTLSFQITPRLTGTFRYNRIGGLGAAGAAGGALFDRSFDLHYRLVDEGRYHPGIAIGLRDLAGTGIYSSEYVVATKHFSPRFRASAGIGWGRLAGRGSFSNPLGVLSSKFNTRPPIAAGAGGTFSTNQWFRGPASLFGGIEYQATNKLTLTAEYSPDLYTQEIGAGNFVQKSPFNFGLKYAYRPNVTLGAYYMYGSELGLTLSYAFNPKNPPNGSGADPAPTPVNLRPSRRIDPASWGIEWASDPASAPILRDNVKLALAADGLELTALKTSPRAVTVHFNNPTFGQTAQALGRAARALTRALPNSVETFTLVPLANGVPTTATVIQRSDMEELEYAPDGAWQSFVRADTEDAAAYALNKSDLAPGLYPKFNWGLGPYLEPQLFDPNNPLLIDFGAKLTARYEPTPGLVFSGEIRQRLAGNLNQSRLVQPYPPGAPPVVRSDNFQYNQFGNLTIQRLTAEYFFRPGKNLYGRVSAGYLERMYGGVSAEVLWKEPGRRLALGVEVNYVKKRNYDQRFGFQNYSVLTGHASAYYDFGNGFHGQLDVGRYLAGDVGATISLDREFDNGWKVGAFATKTNVSAAAFGEGSFDKGIRMTIPTSWTTGRPSRKARESTLRPVQRDGGARLDVQNRLYEAVRGDSSPDLAASWGRFWR